MNEERVIAGFGLREFKKSQIRKLIIETYLENTSLPAEALMKKCQLSRGTFFNYFPTIETIQVASLKYLITKSFFKTGFYDEPLLEELLSHEQFKFLLPAWIKALTNPDLDFVYNECDLHIFFEVDDASCIYNILDRYYSKKFLAKIIFQL